MKLTTHLHLQSINGAFLHLLNTSSRIAYNHKDNLTLTFISNTYEPGWCRVCCGWTIRVSVSDRDKRLPVPFFLILQNAKTSSGAYPASYSVGTVDSFPGVEAADL